MNPPEEVSQPSSLGSLDLIFEQIMSQMERQERQWDHLREKAGVILATTGPLLPIVIQLKAMFGDSQEYPSDLRWVLWGFWGAGILAITAAALWALHAYRLRTFRHDPRPTPFVHGYIGRNPQDTKRQLLANALDSYEHNETVLVDIAKSLRKAYHFLAGAVVIFLLLGLLQWAPLWKPNHPTQTTNLAGGSRIPETSRSDSTLTKHFPPPTQNSSTTPMGRLEGASSMEKRPRENSSTTRESPPDQKANQQKDKPDERPE